MHSNICHNPMTTGTCHCVVEDWIMLNTSLCMHSTEETCFLYFKRALKNIGKMVVIGNRESGS